MLSVLPPNNPYTGEDSLLIPRLRNIETAGLRRSPRIAALNGVNQGGPKIAVYTSSTNEACAFLLLRLQLSRRSLELR